MSDTWSLVTWNVNSIKVRIDQVLDYIHQHEPDVLALQELKVTEDAFPFDALRDAGYTSEIWGQRAYNGVALISKEPLEDIETDFVELEGEESQARCIAGTFDDTRVICLYAPNGKSKGTDKYDYKLRWYEALSEYLEECHGPDEKLAITGDFNIAPEVKDVHTPEAFEDDILFTPPERAALERLMDWGLIDLFRRFDQSAERYSWWDYRAGAFRRNRGVRIDHLLTSIPLAELATDCHIDAAPRKLKQPSDHAPVMGRFRTG